MTLRCTTTASSEVDGECLRSPRAYRNRPIYPRNPNQASCRSRPARVRPALILHMARASVCHGIEYDDLRLAVLEAARDWREEA